MKKIFLLFALAFFCKSAAQFVNIPDPGFKYRLTQAGGYDTNHDGEIDQAEADVVQTMSISSGSPITILNLTGIRAFRNLTHLYLHTSSVTAIDLHEMPHLEYIFVGNVPLLTTLDLSGCPNLYKVMCSSKPQLTSINLLGDSSLGELFLNTNNIGNLDLSTCFNLNTVEVSDNHLSRLTLGFHPNLKIFTARNNLSKTLETIDFSGAPQLETLILSNGGLTSLPLQNLNNLKTVECEQNNLTRLDFTGDVSLETVYCRNNQLESIELYGANNLKELNCFGNKLKVLQINHAKDLHELICAENQIEILDLSNLNIDPTGRRHIDCSKNAMKAFYAYDTHINYLDCSHNDFETLDLSQTWALNFLDAQHTGLYYLKMANQESSGILIDGSRNNLYLEGNTDLFYVCTDDSKVIRFQDYLRSIGLSAKVGSNCSIKPVVTPNPTKDYIFLNGIEKFTLIKLYDATGKFLQYCGDGNITQTIDLSAYGPGIYLLQMSTESGFGNETRKIVKM